MRLTGVFLCRMHASLSAFAALSVLCPMADTLPGQCRCIFKAYALVLNLQLYNLAPIEVAALEAMDEHLCRCDVRRHGNVIQVAETEQVFIVRLQCLLLHGVAEVQQKVDLVAGDTRRNLLIAALWAA